MIITFPNNIVAKNKGAIEKDFFEVDDIKREDVKIKL